MILSIIPSILIIINLGIALYYWDHSNSYMTKANDVKI